MENPIVHAMIAAFLALGEAAGEPILQRAGDYIRRLLADDIMDPEAAAILETVLVGIGEPYVPAPGWFEALVRVH